MKKVCGIYKITSPKGMVYIGQSVDIKSRFSYYKGGHCKYQKKLLNSFKKYGVEFHSFEILEECNMTELNKKEKYYINLFQTFDSLNGLNLTNGGDFKKLSKSSIGKISSTLKRNKVNVGRVFSKETREKMRLSRIGKKHSPETIKKMSESKKGNKHNMFGIEKSNETKDKIRQKHLGKKLTESTIEKMKLRTGIKNGFYGKKHTEDSKNRMSKTKKMK